MSESTETVHEGSNVWEDFRKGYRPGKQLDIHPSITLHTEAEEDLDPVTYEVLRHRLVTINDEHGETLSNVSGSPVAKFSKDFQPNILCEDGEVASHGAFVQLFTPSADLVAKWILENRSGNPGIEPGDVFLCNDPWVGSTHQPDVFVLSPVFHDGELFCWISNALHQADIGGVNPGSFCPDAESIFEEPLPIPPVKIAEQGEVREDIRQLYLRNSRLPQVVALDFSAQLAGIKVTRDRLTDVIEEYGANTVKGAMYKTVDDSEAKFLDKLRKIPDGTWRGRSFLEGAYTGDRRILRGEVQITKDDDQLIFENKGTDENTGAMNISWATFRIAVMVALNPLLAYDSLWESGGPLRHINVETTPGTITSAEWPSGTSNGGVTAISFAFGAIHDALVRMLASSPELRSEIVSGVVTGYGPISHSGINQWGEEFGAMNMDIMGVGTGAKPDGDGVDVGGLYTLTPKGPLPNIEHNEQDMPLLYHYKKEAMDSAGPGEYRSGVGLIYGMVPHKVNKVTNSMPANGSVMPVEHGFAGYPGGPMVHRAVKDSNIQEIFEENGEIISDIKELDGEIEGLPTKATYPQDKNDFVEVGHGSASGYGDPLHREPNAVLGDVRDGYVSENRAYDVYGVVVREDEDGESVLDREATTSRRQDIRDERLADGFIPTEEEG